MTIFNLEEFIESLTISYSISEKKILIKSKYGKLTLPKYLSRKLEEEGKLEEHELLTQPKFAVKFKGFPNNRSIVDYSRNRRTQICWKIRSYE